MFGRVLNVSDQESFISKLSEAVKDPCSDIDLGSW